MGGQCAGSGNVRALRRDYRQREGAIARPQRMAWRTEACQPQSPPLTTVCESQVCSQARRGEVPRHCLEHAKLFGKTALAGFNIDVRPSGTVRPDRQ